MANQARFVYEGGTPLVWGEAGAAGVTSGLTLSFDNLLAGSAIMGVSADLGAQWDIDYLVQLIIESGTAPIAGGAIDLFLASSYNNTTWPGGVTGSASAWPSDGNEDEWAKQLGRPVVSLIATNDTTVIQVQNPVIWRPKGRYVAPVVDNNWDVAVKDEATATNNDSRVILVPIRTLLIDP